jgi:pilus assembly protein CpaB
MNNNVLKVIAGILAIGAVIVAAIGVRLSGRPAAAPTAPAVVEQRQPVLVATRAVSAGQVLKPSDVEVQHMLVEVAPAGALQLPQQAVGLVSAQAIAKGAPILMGLVAPDSLAALLRQGERAIAVQVDEIVGVGGFVRPGDHVDVLQFVSANRETTDTTFAQIVVSNARILTFGDASQIDAAMSISSSNMPSSTSTSATDVTQEALKETGVKATSQAREHRQNLRSAVLALREADASRLMLAANTGQLRLALRPKADTTIEAGSPAEELAPRMGTRMADVAPIKAKTKTSSADATEPIIIQEGSKERRLTRNNDAPLQP